MNPTRREALKLAGMVTTTTAFSPLALALGLPVGSGALYPPGNPQPWPVVQGPTDRSSATFILLLPAAPEFDIDVRDQEGGAQAMRVAARRELAPLGLCATEIVASGLTPGRDYVLHVRQSDGRYADRRLFRTLDLAQARLRFAVASCMNDSFRQHTVTMWEALAREHCDFVVLLGDTCYADLRNPEKDEAGFARRYAETRLALSWFKMERLVPSFAVWDDHDFGANNGDRTFPLGAAMRPLFRSFWGSTDNSAWRKGVGAGSKLSAFGQRFYLLDDRSFRDPPEAPGRRHWGAEQSDWLLDDLSRSSEPAWIMSGNQFFSDRTIRESVEVDYPADLEVLTRMLSRLPAPVAFVSGDVHHSEIKPVDPRRLGYGTYEFTSSSIHSFPFPGPIYLGRDPQPLVAERRHNFMMFDVDARREWSIRSRAVLEGNVVAFDRSFEIER